MNKSLRGEDFQRLAHFLHSSSTRSTKRASRAAHGKHKKDHYFLFHTLSISTKYSIRKLYSEPITCVLVSKNHLKRHICATM